MESERGDHGGDGAFLLGARPLPSRRAKPRGPTSRQLPEIEGCPPLDRVLAPEVRLGPCVGAVGGGRDAGGDGSGGGGGGGVCGDGGLHGSLFEKKERRKIM